jgi:hypothetical protein
MYFIECLFFTDMANNMKSYNCPDCSKNYSSYTSFYYHKKTKHGVSSQEVTKFYENERNRKKSKTTQKEIKDTRKTTGDKTQKRQRDSSQGNTDQAPAKKSILPEDKHSHLPAMSGHASSSSFILDDLMPTDISDTLQDMCDALKVVKENPWKNVVVKVSDIRLQGKITRQLLKNQDRSDEELFKLIRGNISPTKADVQEFSTICCAVRRAMNSTLLAVKMGIEDLVQPR